MFRSLSIVSIAFVLFAIGLGSFQIIAQENRPPLLPNLSVITDQNVSQVRELERLGRGQINKIAFSSDDSKLAVASSIGIWLYDVSNLNEEPSFLDAGWVDALVFHPLEPTLIFGKADGSIVLWDTVKSEVKGILEGHTAKVNAVSLSPDGNTLVSSSNDSTLRLWDMPSRTILTVIEQFSSFVVFNPNGQTFISSGTSSLHDAVTGARLTTLPANEFGFQTSLSFSPDGQILATGSSSGYRTQLWDVTSGALLLRELKGHGGHVISTSFSPDNSTLASGDEVGNVILWDPASGESRGILKNHTGLITSLAFTSDGKRLASGSWDGTIRLWDISSKNLLLTLDGYLDRISSLLFSSDGQTFISSNYSTVRQWDAVTGALIGTFKENVNSNRIHCVITLKFDVPLIGCGDEEGNIWLREALSGNLRLAVKGKGSDWSIFSTMFSPDGHLFAASDLYETTRIWNTASGELITTIEGSRTLMAFSPDGQTLASEDTDNKVRLWDVSSGELQTELEAPMNSYVFTTFSPDGSIFAATSTLGNNWMVQVWDVASGQLLTTLEEHIDEVRSMTFSPDSRMLATPGTDTTIRLWDLTSGELVATLEGHLSRVTDIAFAPNGEIIASASKDKTIRLWDVRLGTQQAVLEGHTADVDVVTFSLDGKFIVSSGKDSTIRFWGIPVSK